MYSRESRPFGYNDTKMFGFWCRFHALNDCIPRLRFNVLSIDYVRVTNCFYDYDYDYDPTFGSVRPRSTARTMWKLRSCSAADYQSVRVSITNRSHHDRYRHEGRPKLGARGRARQC